MPTLPLVSFIIPAYNEASIIEKNLAEIHRHIAGLHHEYRTEIIVVNDGSSDETLALAWAFAALHSDVYVLNHPINRGLAAALQTGVFHANGDVIVTLDVDLSYDPTHIDRLLMELRRTGAAMVLTSPYMKGGKVKNVPWDRHMLSAGANRFLSAAAGGAVSTLTGMVRAYDAHALRSLTVDAKGMDINHALVFAALKQDLTVVEIPACLEWRRPSGDQPARRSSMKIFAHMWAVMQDAFRHRPAMLLALPGLIPGVWPFMAAVTYFLGASHQTIVAVTLGTAIVQTVSFGYFCLLTGRYVFGWRLLPQAARIFNEKGTTSRA